MIGQILHFSSFLFIYTTLHSGVSCCTCTIVQEPLQTLLLDCIIVCRPLCPRSSQRGLLCCMLQAHIYCMRLYCYDSYSDDDSAKELLFRCSAWICAMPLGLRYYIRADRLSIAMLAHSYLVPRPKLDYYA
jgi:hypothetical protein